MEYCEIIDVGRERQPKFGVTHAGEQLGTWLGGALAEEALPAPLTERPVRLSGIFTFVAAAGSSAADSTTSSVSNLSILSASKVRR